LEKRALGKSGIEIPPLVFGGNVFGWTADQAASFRLLDALVDAGFNAIDTADMYSTWVPGHQGGESETVIGNWLKQRGGRDKLLIFTKVGMPMGSGGKGLSKGWITEEVEHSLARLQTDYIDLYQSHLDDCPAKCDCADRQRYQSRSAAGSGEGGRAEAQARRNRGAEPGERLGDPYCTEEAAGCPQACRRAHDLWRCRWHAGLRARHHGDRGPSGFCRYPTALPGTPTHPSIRLNAGEETDAHAMGRRADVGGSPLRANHPRNDGT